MKILNLYAGIGGNRKLWGNDHEITAIEHDAQIASIYQDLYPNDTVIVDDAHQYLLDHYQEYEDGFIWASPPCPTHSVLNFALKGIGIVRYPDMSLYQEIILLKHFFKGKYCIENVKSYYDPLIQPQISGRHYFWANLTIPPSESRISIRDISGQNGKQNIDKAKNMLGFDLSKYKCPDKRKLIRNCVDPHIGKTILDKVIETMRDNSIRQNCLF